MYRRRVSSRSGLRRTAAKPGAEAELWSSLDSPLEGTGFEPSVPRGKGPTLRVSVLFHSDFSAGGEPTRGDIESLVVSRGTDGSNPVPSSGGSRANLTFGAHRSQIRWDVAPGLIERRQRQRPIYRDRDQATIG